MRQHPLSSAAAYEKYCIRLHSSQHQNCSDTVNFSPPPPFLLTSWKRITIIERGIIIINRLFFVSLLNFKLICFQMIDTLFPLHPHALLFLSFVGLKSFLYFFLEVQYSTYIHTYLYLYLCIGNSIGK